MATQLNENSIEALKKMMTQAAQIGTLPDADMEFVTGLQMQIRDQILKQTQSLANMGGGGLGGQMPQMAPPPPEMGMGMDMGMGMPPEMMMPPPEVSGGMGPGGGQGLPGLAVPPPNPDELRRLLEIGG